ncbi:MAG: phosphoribosylformylglycinamidine synthase subunit PurS [Saprospiraceae bacterium]|nr:phosphoribosylformylglycinamidine synthase subunit PurS [Saprospiraceae bacterium]
MKFKAAIDVMPHKELLDPQGKTVAKNMHNLEIDGVDSVRIGKHIELTLEANDADEARIKVETACKKLLANVIMETYTYELTVA